jgi:DMSO/TMAO reductase YedYZ molybdopterin-dependent catalytic subunit
VRTVPRRLLALAGALAALCGIAVSLALTNLLNGRANPVQIVAEAVIERTPGSIAEFLIGLVGRNDKPFLVAGVTLAIVLLGALAGILSGRSRLVGNVVFVAMAVVALLAAMSRSDFSPITLIPLGVGTAAWVVVLNVLLDALAPTAAEPGADPSRRGFLLRAAIVAGGAAAVGIGGQFFGRTRRAVETSRRLLQLPVSPGTVPGGAAPELAGVVPWRVGNATFYRIDTALVLPAVDPNKWRLRIHGMVDREVSIGYRDLLDRELTETWLTICCVSNPVGGELIGNAWWSGVRVADLLAEAGVHPDADAVRQTSKDGWTCGTPLEALTDDRNALLAIAMNGEPLPLEHGFPVRMVVPGLYGYVSATKWLVDLEVSRFDRFDAYWTDKGWSERGPVKTQSRIEVPRNGQDVKAGQLRVGGHAWAQHTGIEAVEVRLDGGAWQPVELARVPSVDTWVQWVGTLDVPPGDHTLAVRATDRSGYTQTAVRTDVVPDGATGWHTIELSAD